MLDYITVISFISCALLRFCSVLFFPRRKEYESSASSYLPSCPSLSISVSTIAEGPNELSLLMRGRGSRSCSHLSFFHHTDEKGV